MAKCLNSVLIFFRNWKMQLWGHLSQMFQVNRVSSVGDVRHIPIGESICYQKKYPNNKVNTSKYTLWSFLPLNLFSQFRRIANFYFLAGGIILLSIDSPISPWTGLLPLVFVISVTAVKQAYEDFLRHKADKELNNTPVTIIRNGVEQKVQSQCIQVGDMVLVVRDQDVPCDLVLLASSQINGRCYLTTANLDGESNLKTVHLPPPLRHVRTVEQLLSIKGFVECEEPQADLYHFLGRIELSDPVLAPPAPPPTAKSSRLSIDSITARMRLHSENHDEQEQLSAPLSMEHVLLKGSRLKNTDFIYGCAVYTGQQTKVALNSLIRRTKFSSVEKSINLYLVFALGLLFTLTVTSTLCKYLRERSHLRQETKPSYLADLTEITAASIFYDFLSFLLLYNYLLPISLYVTIEMQKFLGALFFKWDNQMYCPDTNRPAVCNTSDLNEELGLVEYLFADKTGTLTENAMIFRRCCINGLPYSEEGGVLKLLSKDGDTKHGIRMTEFTASMDLFFLALSLCHTVQLEYVEPGETDGSPSYNSSSPDERALLLGSARCGVVFVGESDGYYVIKVRDDIVAYRRLEVLEFTSERKRMSIVVRDSAGKVWLFCKGAETTILPLVTKGQKAKTMACVQEFAMRGLRTMLVACRQIAKEEYVAALNAVREARAHMSQNRESLVSEACEGVERDLTLLGATAVEDRLQPGVRETLSDLRTAGIKTWVLTGDKVETAISISYSSGHFQMDTDLLYLTEHTTPATVSRTLKTLQQRVSSGHNYGLVSDGQSLSLALEHMPDALLKVGQACSAVICCRLSPLQKCQMVRIVKASPGRPIAAAIGDGANDVSMIQEAHVGIGIMGKEGRQAERCSDFSLARFRFVQRALLVHGHWYYIRLATLVHYFFYKNLVFILPQFYFTIYSNFSKRSFYDSMFLTCYNIIFTSGPILLFGIMEQDRPAYQLLQHPHLYKYCKRNALMTRKSCFLSICFGIYHSLVVFFAPILAMGADLDICGMSLIVYFSAVIIVNLKLLLMSHYWTAPLILSVIGSILLLFIVNAIYSSIFLEDCCAAFFILTNTIQFWVLIILILALSLLPDVIFLTATTIIQIKKDPALKYTPRVLCCCLQKRNTRPTSLRTEFNRKSGRISFLRGRRSSSIQVRVQTDRRQTHDSTIRGSVSNSSNDDNNEEEIGAHN